MYYQIEIKSRYLIKTDATHAEILANIEDYVNKIELIKDLQKKDLSDVMDVTVYRTDEPEELICLNCGDEITEEELASNGQYCDDCFGEDNEEITE